MKNLRPRKMKIRLHKLTKKGLGDFCACGCGERTNVLRGISKTYLHGHNSDGKKIREWIKKNGSGYKGKIRSEESKKKGADKFRGMLSGNKHPNWKGGKTAEDKLERGKFKWYIQKKVIERDNYTCQICNTRGVALQVDHIQSWSEYTELRFSMDNCRTLCQKCHYKITFGREMPVEVKTWGQNFNLLERMGH
jgi:hypothetical protein